MPQVRAIFTELLREPAASAARIAEVVSVVLRRNEEARIYQTIARLKALGAVGILVTRIERLMP